MSRNGRQQRSAPKPLNQSLSQHHGWKENPVIVAGGSVAATALFCIAVVNQIVIPTQTAKLETEILKAKDTLRNLEEDLAAERNRNEGLLSKISLLSSQVVTLGKQLMEARIGALFGPGNPYPTGLGVVRIGTPIDEVRNNFPSSQIETIFDQPDILIVNLNNSPFRYIQYSFYKKDSRKRIASATFTIDHDKEFGDNFLPNKVTEAIGSPVEQPQRGYYRWPDTAGVKVYLVDDTYMIMAPGFAPAVWPE